MPLSALIVDDEEMARYYLRSNLEEYCKEITQINEAKSVGEALESIELNQPQILFVDIRMPNEDGFELLEKLYTTELFYIVFVTAYDEYALKALKGGAFDYLLKPVEHADLKQVVNRIYNDYVKKIARLHNSFLTSKIPIRHSSGFTLLSLKEITYLEAANNYTNIHLQSGKSICVSKTLKELHIKLNNSIFIRIHKSFVISLFHIKGYLHKPGGNYIQIADKTTIPITRFSMQQIEDLVSTVNQSSF